MTRATRRCWVLAAASLTGAAGLLLPTTPVSAADVTTGSWTQLRQTTPVGVTPDLQTTDGTDLPVANTPVGPVSIAAVRMPASATTLELTRVDPASGLPELPAVVPVPSPVVWACPATGSWSAGDRQPWDARPGYDCSRHAVGSVSAAGMFFDLTALGQPAVDLVLVPGDGETNAFDLSFAPPTAAAFQLTDAPLPTEPDGGLPSDQPVGQPAGSTVTAPDLPVALPSTAGVPGPPVVAYQPVAPRTTHALRAANTETAPRWVGAALLAFLSSLLMLRAAMPSRPAGAARALVTVQPERETA